MPRHDLPTRDRTGFTTRQVRDDYQAATHAQVEDIAREYGKSVSVIRKVGKKTKYSLTSEERFLFKFQANVVYAPAPNERDFSVNYAQSISIYVPKRTLDDIAAKNPEHTLMPTDFFEVDKVMYQMESTKPRGTFLDTTGEIVFTASQV